MMNSRANRTVFKLGGSLMYQADWPIRLREWLHRQPPGEYFGAVGGGRLIDALRELDHQHTLSQDRMHWRCIRVLDATFEIAAELTPDFYRIGSPHELDSIASNRWKGRETVRPFWVRIAAYYSPELVATMSNALLPELDWNTTSDSLALLLASRIQADRCVLLKSCPVDHLRSLSQAVEERVIDPETLRFQVAVPSIELARI